jgi:hypothetical protein
MRVPRYRLALLWSATAACAGTFCVVVVAATLAALAGNYSGSVVSAWIGSALVESYFAGFIALICIVPYTLLLVAWQIVVQRCPRAEQTTAAVFTSCGLLAVPIAAVVFWSNLDPFGPFKPYWSGAFTGGGIVFVGTWVGLFLPRVTVPALRTGRLIAA